MNSQSQRRKHLACHALAVAGVAAALMAGQALSASHVAAWEMRVCADPNHMPQTNRAMEGYENRIAEILADDLGAELTYQWWTQSQSMISDQLREGNCDMMIGVPDGGGTVISTVAYYRSPYAFVYRTDEDYDISSFDDPVLEELRLGTTSDVASPYLALRRRNLTHDVVLGASLRGAPDASPAIVEEVANGGVDVAILWGPEAGYFASLQETDLTVTPAPEIDLPFTPLYHTIVIAVRLGDESLRDLLNEAIARRWDDIQAVLEEYRVPTLSLPRPTLSLEERQP